MTEQTDTDTRARYTLRPAAAPDEDFLFALYAGTRAAEFAPLGWPEAQLNAILRMQFNAQQRAYEAQYSAAGHQIVLLDGQPVGRIWVERNGNEILLVDIALLPATRGHGIGTQLIKELIAESAATGTPLRLMVVKDNDAARRLYERLGFVIDGEDGPRYHMEHRAAAATEQQDAQS
jgi:ribosomal protein S18 acetylase RimI-like enzyme